MYSQFRPGEVRDIIVAWLVVSIALSFVEGGVLHGAYEIVIAAFVASATAFILHEMGHKSVAIRYGYGAHFQIWAWGIAMILIIGVLSTLGGFPLLFGAPGAVYIEPTNTGNYGFGYYSTTYRPTNLQKDNMIISAAGPGVNLLFTLLFFLLGVARHVGSLLHTVGVFGFLLNIGLGSFNMLPFPPLDGFKIFRGNVFVGLALALPMWVPLGLIYLQVLPIP